MDDLWNQRCRLCSQVYCCKACRVNHESAVHRVNPDCDICLYGYTSVGDLRTCPISLLEHISGHLPVHCINCRIIFNTLPDILTHSFCGIQREEETRNEQSPGFYSSRIVDYDSPTFENLILGNKFDTVGVTSTPMNRNEDREVVLSADTPVNNNNEVKEKGADNEKKEDPKKRKVTFMETPESMKITENISEEPESKEDSDAKEVQNKQGSEPEEHEKLEEQEKPERQGKHETEDLDANDSDASSDLGCSFYSFYDVTIDGDDSDSEKVLEIAENSFMHQIEVDAQMQTPSQPSKKNVADEIECNIKTPSQSSFKDTKFVDGSFKIPKVSSLASHNENEFKTPDNKVEKPADFKADFKDTKFVDSSLKIPKVSSLASNNENEFKTPVSKVEKLADFKGFKDTNFVDGFFKIPKVSSLASNNEFQTADNNLENPIDVKSVLNEIRNVNNEQNITNWQTACNFSTTETPQEMQNEITGLPNNLLLETPPLNLLVNPALKTNPLVNMLKKYMPTSTPNQNVNQKSNFDETQSISRISIHAPDKSTEKAEEKEIVSNTDKMADQEVVPKVKKDLSDEFKQTTHANIIEPTENVEKKEEVNQNAESEPEPNIWIKLNNFINSIVGESSSPPTSRSESYKRNISEISDSTVNEPPLKRFKSFDIKCRKSVRDLPSNPLCELSIEKSTKTFADKATQTDE